MGFLGINCVGVIFLCRGNENNKIEKVQGLLGRTEN